MLAAVSVWLKGMATLGLSKSRRALPLLSQAGGLRGADASAVAAAVSSALAAAKPEEVGEGVAAANRQRCSCSVGMQAGWWVHVACKGGFAAVQAPAAPPSSHLFATPSPGYYATPCPPPQADHRSGRLAELIRQQANQKNALTLPRLSATAGGEGAEAAEGAGAPPPPVVVHAVLNPLSKAAQRLAPLLGFLRDLLDSEALLLLNPKASALASTRFARFAIAGLEAGSAATQWQHYAERQPPAMRCHLCPSRLPSIPSTSPPPSAAA